MDWGVIVLFIVGYLILCAACSLILGMLDFVGSLFVGVFHNPPAWWGVVKFFISPLIALTLVVVGTTASVWEKVRYRQ